MSHDSIGLGEDGPTHQPVEQLSHLRSVPNLNVLRPADTTETLECWQLALENPSTPSILALTRQKLDPIRKQFSKENKCLKGADEILRTNEKVELTLLASGAEVNIAPPKTLLPHSIERLGVKSFTDMKKGLDKCDIVMMLRLQNERMHGSFFCLLYTSPSPRD